LHHPFQNQISDATTTMTAKGRKKRKSQTWAERSAFLGKILPYLPIYLIHRYKKYCSFEYL
jgi:hypothetical protein